MSELVRKSQLDGRVAELLGKKRRDVSAVTEAFLQEVVKALVESGEVRLDGLGTLRVDCRSGVRQPTVLVNAPRSDGTRDVAVVDVERKYYVNFRRSSRLRTALRKLHGKHRERRIPMEKYGVDENVDGEKLEKQASEGCPGCGAKVQRHGNVLVCPNCGTAPFEQKQQ